jgi:hypothetical protein
MWITLHFNDSMMTKQWQSITSLTTQWLCFVDVDYMFWFMNEYIMISLIGTCIGVNSYHILSIVAILSTILIILADVDYMLWLMNEYIMICLTGTCIGVKSCHIHSTIVILSTILIINMNVLPTYITFTYSIEWKLVGKLCGNFHSNFKLSKMGK